MDEETTQTGAIDGDAALDAAESVETTETAGETPGAEAEPSAESTDENSDGGGDTPDPVVETLNQQLESLKASNRAMSRERAEARQKAQAYEQQFGPLNAPAAQTTQAQQFTPAPANLTEALNDYTGEGGRFYSIDPNLNPVIGGRIADGKDQTVYFGAETDPEAAVADYANWLKPGMAIKLAKAEALEQREQALHTQAQQTQAQQALTELTACWDKSIKDMRGTALPQITDPKTQAIVDAKIRRGVMAEMGAQGVDYAALVAFDPDAMDKINDFIHKETLEFRDLMIAASRMQLDANAQAAGSAPPTSTGPAALPHQEVPKWGTPERTAYDIEQAERIMLGNGLKPS